MSKIYVKKNNILKYLMITVWLFAEYRYFNMPRDLNAWLVKYNTMSVHYVKIIILIIMFFLLRKKNINIVLFHTKEMIFLLLTLTLSACVSIVKYGYLIKTFERFVNILYLPILFFVLSSTLKTEEDIRKFVKILTLINLLSVSIYIIQAFMYNNYGTMFLTFRWEQNTISKRNGYIRIIECLNMTLISFALSTAMTYRIKSNDRILHIINILVSSYYLVYVSMTRIIVFIAGMIFAVVYVIKYKPRKKMLQILKWIIVSCTIILCATIGTQEVIEYLNSVKMENSYISRAGAVIYYLELIKETIISGFLFVDFTGSTFYSVAHGAGGRFFTSDVGVLGIIINYGMLTFVVYIYIIIKFAVKYKRSRNLYDFIFFIYMLFTMPTQAQLDLQRLGVFGMLLALSEKSNELSLLE